MYSNRDYRLKHSVNDLTAFNITIKDTDLWVAVDKASFFSSLPNEVENYVFELRMEVEEYIKNDPNFYLSLEPCLLKNNMPSIVQTMTIATLNYGVGPMASVAGTFSDYVGNYLSKKCKEIIIENGGDIYLKTKRERIIAVFAGESPFSNRIGIKIKGNTIRGICTSSGTVGPSLSLGKSDATLVIAKTAAVADAAATMLGNKVQNEEDIEQVISFAQHQRGILGALIIKNDKLGAFGEIQLIPIDK